jgi:hypothetical protein
VKEDNIKILVLEVNCISHIYERLTKIDLVGLPLQESQICAGQPVTLVIGKPLSEGELVAHNGSWPSPADGRQMKISTASTVINLTKLLVPSHTIARHKQTLQWLMDHGEHAVVQIRTLCTRSLTPPHPSNYDASLEDSSQSEARSTALPSHSTHAREDDINMSDANEVFIHLDSSHDADVHQDHDHDTLEDDNAELTDHEQVVIEAIRHAQEIIRQHEVYNKLVTRVLDDAYHFMDRLLRLISKKHSIFKEFAHQFSKTIFIRDKDNEVKVRAVLEEKGISWEYAIRAKKSALNRRIR